MRVTDPILYLREEHEHALAALDRLEGGLRDLGKDPKALEVIREAVRFVNHEVRHHNEREEKVLFPRLSERTPPGGPVEVMLAEHRQLWEHLDRLEEALGRIPAQGAPDQEVESEIRARGQAILDLLRAHIQKENMVLFRMADELIPPEVKQTMAAEMEELVAKENPSGAS
jgi:hemerythrin-like domain-containing protein